MSNNDENPENPDVSDKTTEEISFNFICDWFAEQFGHGWKRRLAKVAGVPESNVYSWIKAGRLPPWVQRVFKLLIETSRLRRNEKFVAKQITKFRQVGQVVEDGDGFAVYHSDEGVGKLVARSIPDLETAREIAALPRLKKMSAEISEMLNYLIINEILLEDWFSDDEKAVLDEIEDWSATPVLSDKLSDAIITDIAEALVILTNDVVAETQ